MWHRLWLLLDQPDRNKLITSAFILLLGVLLRDLFPYLWNMLIRGLTWVGEKIGGRFGYRYFEKAYLNWLVTELRELKLTGIVSAESAKKPRLEQVFVSLKVGEAQGKFSAVEASLAIVEEMRKHRGKIDHSVVRALKRDIEPGCPAPCRFCKGRARHHDCPPSLGFLRVGVHSVASHS